MRVVKKNALVPFSAQQMFELVKDVESYPNFLPWCSGAKIHEQLENGVIASVDISKGKLQKAFTTKNIFTTNKKIDMQLVDGPFSKLHGAWLFDSIGDQGCRVALDLEFDFSSAIARLTIGPIFNIIADKLLDSFVAEAEKIYG